jgi:hypothetical protein
MGIREEFQTKELLSNWTFEHHGVDELHLELVIDDDQ